jgi:hypothetical protein
MGRKRGKRLGWRKAVRDKKVNWRDNGPVAHRDLIILFRDRRIKEMSVLEMGFMEQRRYLDQQMVMK